MPVTAFKKECFKFKKLTITKGSHTFTYQGFLAPCLEQQGMDAFFSNERLIFFATEGTVLKLNLLWERIELENTRIMDEHLKQGMQNVLRQAKLTYKKQLQLQKFLEEVQKKYSILQEQLRVEETEREDLLVQTVNGLAFQLQQDSQLAYT